MSHTFKFKKKVIALKGFMVLDDISDTRSVICEPITNHSNDFLIFSADSSSLPPSSEHLQHVAHRAPCPHLVPHRTSSHRQPAQVPNSLQINTRIAYLRAILLAHNAPREACDHRFLVFPKPSLSCLPPDTSSWCHLAAPYAIRI